MSESIHYVKLHGQRQGPFTTSQVRTFIDAGLVRPDTLSEAERNPLNQPVSNFNLLGCLFTLVGVAGAVYFLVFFDVSVATPSITQEVLGISRVNNIGLMQDRQNGLIISLVVGVVGVALLIAGHLSGQRKAPR